MDQKIKNSILSGGTSKDDQLINNASATSAVDSSPKYFFLFLILSVASALLASWKISAFNETPAWSFAFSAILGTGLFLFFSTFIPWFVRSLVYGVIFALFTTLAFISFFASGFSVWTFAGALIFIIMFISAFYQTRLKLDNWLRVLFFQNSAAFIKTVGSGLALFLALLYAGIFVQSAAISPATNDILLDMAKPVIGTVIPNFSKKMTIDQAIIEVGKDQLVDSKNFAGVDLIEKEALISQAVPEVKRQIVETTKTPIEDNDTFATYTNRIFNNLIAKAQSKGILPLVGLVVFLATFGFFKLIFSIVRIIIAPFALIVYYLLRSVGVIQIATENRPKEVIILK